MNTSLPIENQLLVTKFHVPVPSSSRISRPRLTTLLNESRKYPLTLVSAPAGFGKTTLLASWAQSLQARGPRVAWVSLEEEDNEPQLFWAYILTALNRQLPEHFTSLLTQLQSPQSPPLGTLLAMLINRLAEGTDDFLLILDDYHLITEPQVHTALTYLVEHLPTQLHVIVATRADPPLPLPLLRSRRQVLEVRTDQLRCTPEETRAFLDEVMGIHLPDEAIREVTARTEGWLVGLQLLGLSDHVNSVNLLKEISGDQRYILDFLTQEVLEQQPQEIQTFLLSTSILEERLTASLCNAVMQQAGSEQMLQQIEQANLFVVSLDSRREWYRYHALFAEALQYQLEQTQPDLLPSLHHRASLWYAQNAQPTQAIVHALRAKDWPWAADLIEAQSAALNSLTWGIRKQRVLLLRDWLQQIPVDLLYARPRLCLAYAWMLHATISQTVLETRLNAVETQLTTELMSQTHQQNASAMLLPPARQELENLLGEALAYRALMRSYDGDGEAALTLCQQAQALLRADNVGVRGHLTVTKLFATYASSINDAVATVQMGLQAVSLSQAVGNTDQVICLIGATAPYMIGIGHLHQTQQLTQQAMLLGRKPGALVLPIVGRPMIWQAEVLREWNQLEAAHSLVEEAIELCEQIESPLSLVISHSGYAILLRVCLSRGDYHAARSALQAFERVGSSMNQPMQLYFRSLFATIDQVRLWLACGERDRAIGWAEELDLTEQSGTPFLREREEVACARILLAKQQPVLALQRLEPTLQRATTGQRWGHVIEIRLLQALAHQMLQEEELALEVLSEAVRLAEPESYIRSFVDEGTTMESLLYQLRRRNRQHGPTPYLDMLLAAFEQETKTHAQPAEPPAPAHQLPESLSQREREVLQLLAQGLSNQEIAQELIIAYDTVKRHANHIFSKLGVHNRIQAVKQARELGLLDEEV